MRLPNLNKEEPHYNELTLRKKSLSHLLGYLNQKNGKVLDLGCGNGWMSAKLSEHGFQVTGMDVNETELIQAKRVFGEKIKWVLADVFTLKPVSDYDIVLLSASLQYFKNPSKLLAKLQTLLADGGKIIVMDTFFYEENEIESARKRSADYYQKMGDSAMCKHYFHHAFQDLAPFKYAFVFKPKNKWIRRIFKSSPFPIIAIGKQ